MKGSPVKVELFIGICNLASIRNWERIKKKKLNSLSCCSFDEVFCIVTGDTFCCNLFLIC